MKSKQVKIIPVFIACLLTIQTLWSQNQEVYKTFDEDKLPYGNSFSSWEKKPKTNKIYHVAQNQPGASDNNAGTKEEPFLTIGKAAEILQPGEKVIIHEGVYREQITPARGGSSADKLIIYQAAVGEKVIVKGSLSCNPKQWKPSRGWQVGGSTPFTDKNQNKQQVWQYDLHDIDFNGYNPFGLLNLMQDQEYLDYTQVNMTPHFKKRGWVIIDGQRIEQVLKPRQLREKEKGAFWAEHNGLRIHVRFPDGQTPENVTTEISIREQLFAPQEYGLAYIKIKGIHFMHAANGFPVPQRGAVSAARGHHWIIEDCIIEGVNSLGMDLGNEMWHTETEEIVGHHIIRRNTIKNCGLAGLQGMRAKNYLVEDNLFENIGWHDAEHCWEAGAIKFHLSENTLIRRNVFRNIRHAPGIWLDYLASKNCRITKNVFTGITSARGCVYIEVSHHKMSIDHNVFHDTHSQYWISGDYGAGGSALYTDGTDSIHFHHNLIFDIENTGFGAYTNAERMVGGRGSTDREHLVTHNIFANCGKHAIELPNRQHFTDHNLFAAMPSGFLKVKYPEPGLFIHLKAWQDLFQWDLNGKVIPDPKFKLNAEKLIIRAENYDQSSGDAGPFQQSLEMKNGISIDPRQLK